MFSPDLRHQHLADEPDTRVNVLAGMLSLNSFNSTNVFADAQSHYVRQDALAAQQNNPETGEPNA